MQEARGRQQPFVVECLKKGEGKSVACRGDLSMTVCMCCIFWYTHTQAERWPRERSKRVGCIPGRARLLERKKEGRKRGPRATWPLHGPPFLIGILLAQPDLSKVRFIRRLYLPPIYPPRYLPLVYARTHRESPHPRCEPMNRPPTVAGSRILGLLVRIVCNVTGEISRAVWDLYPPTPSLFYSNRCDLRSLHSWIH